MVWRKDGLETKVLGWESGDLGSVLSFAADLQCDLRQVTDESHVLKGI